MARHYFQKRWRRVALLTGAADQFERLAQIIVWAAAAFIISAAVINLKFVGWGWWAGAMVLICAALGILISGVMRRCYPAAVISGVAVLVAALVTPTIGWVALIATAGATVAIYRPPRSLHLAARIDALQHWPSTSTAALSLMQCLPVSAPPIAQSFECRLYQRAGEGMDSIRALALLRPRDLGRQWAKALLFLFLAAACGFMLSTGLPPIPKGVNPRAIPKAPLTAERGLAKFHEAPRQPSHQPAASARPPAQPMAESKPKSGGTKAGLTSKRNAARAAGHLKKSGSVHGAAETQMTTARLQENINTTRSMQAKLAALTAKSGTAAVLSQGTAAQLSKDLQQLKPLGTGVVALSDIKHDLAASSKGHAGPLVSELQKQLKKILAINRHQLEAFKLPTYGTSPVGLAGQHTGRTKSTGHPSRSGKAGQATSGMRMRTGRGQLMPAQTGAVPAHRHAGYTADGVRMYTYDAPTRPAGRGSAHQLWRAASRALAPETGYIPHRYRAIIHRYFSGTHNAH